VHNLSPITSSATPATIGNQTKKVGKLLLATLAPFSKKELLKEFLAGLPKNFQISIQIQG
jgi:hypothetical protein